VWSDALAVYHLAELSSRVHQLTGQFIRLAAHDIPVPWDIVLENG
jgi:hypothetical protein